MSIKTFKDGSVLYTGDDIYKHFERCWNKRDNYQTSCNYCKHENSERCEECSIPSGISCSCHLTPPCSKCVNNGFEPTKHLINYENYSAYKMKGSKAKPKWECFPTTKEIFEKFTKLEKAGLRLSAEILNTGEIVIYLGKPYDDKNEKIEICEKLKFKSVAEKMIKKS